MQAPSLSNWPRSLRKRSLSSFSFTITISSRNSCPGENTRRVDDDLHQVVLPQPPVPFRSRPGTDADADEYAGEEVVDADGERHDAVDLR